MQYQKGHKIKFINENLEGEIKEVLDNNFLLIACSDGFDLKVNAATVIVIDENDQLGFHIDETVIKDKLKQVVAHEKKSSGFLSKYLSHSKYKSERVLEVDLHLEELVEFPNKLDDWQKLHTQMLHVKKCLNAAFNENVKRIVFIHGVGTGVLRTELLNFLSDYEDIIIRDADYREYGIGATEVVIK